MGLEKWIESVDQTGQSGWVKNTIGKNTIG
ncbi:MAG: hypothetical protein RIS56_2255 [Verrucomicrobiota bacterium]|jgi:hypothetical protein